MKNNQNVCVYCRKDIPEHSLKWRVRVATKPKKTPHRFKIVGNCCTDCRYEEKPVIIDNY